MELEEEIISDKIELAVLQFKAKNYDKCVAIYSELVHQMSGFGEARVVKTRRYHGLSDRPTYGLLVHPKLCSILDQRAASHEKLSERHLAIKDAKKIIAIDPVNCKGYLRLGKLHLQNDDRVAAYKTYQEGVFLIQKALSKSDVSVPDRLWTQLQTMYRDLNRVLRQERGATSSRDTNRAITKTKPDQENTIERPKKTALSSRGLQGSLDRMLPLKRTTVATPAATKRPRLGHDIFEVLPKEIAEIIFSFLPFRDVLKAHLVCKSWYETLMGIPGLYKNNFALKHRVSAPEYFHGLKMMKRVSQSSFSQSVHSLSVWSTANLHHLGKIIESVVSDETLRLSRLHLIDKTLSMELVLKVLEKCKWEYSALQSVRHLRLGINSSLYNGNFIFRIFPHLESLEILSIDSGSRRSNLSLIPSFSDKYHELLTAAADMQSQPTLKKLSLVNHPMLKRAHQSVRAGENTFLAGPPLLKLRFHTLTEIKITSYDFAGIAVELQTFLRGAPTLSEVYFENNEELSLRKFLLLLSSCSPEFKLTKLTFRETHHEGSYNIDEIVPEDLGCLSGLTHLDIYGSYISGPGFLKLSRIANKDEQLVHINMGHASYVQFKNDNLVAGNSVLRFSQLLEIVPKIETLRIPELNLDSLSMRLLSEDLQKVSSAQRSDITLKNLDLSFCHSVDGVGLMNLFRGAQSPGPGQGSQIRLETLILDGLHFNSDTLQLLQKRGYTRKIQNDPFKKKWRSYGVNSLVLDTE